MRGGERHERGHGTELFPSPIHGQAMGMARLAGVGHGRGHNVAPAFGPAGKVFADSLLRWYRRRLAPDSGTAQGGLLVPRSSATS